MVKKPRDAVIEDATQYLLTELRKIAMAKPKKPRERDAVIADATTIRPCQYREGDWRCIRNAVYDVLGPDTLAFVHHVGEPSDREDIATGAFDPVHVMHNTRTLRERIIMTGSL